ncbi:hypothetical protein VTN00DRAFT_713 [Thermoascus crustaceus]|uniref:uncharacterized protein n=1 Tax=Thermoascus crustaceus TaxID=5088 RepID=UPI003743D6B6
MDGFTYHGSCLCEGISFNIRGQPEKVFMCYCSDCQKNAGAPYQICAKFDKDQVETLEKEAQIGNWIVRQTVSGAEKHKRFCTRCGCTLWTVPMNHGGEKFIVRTALLEGGLETLRPAAEFFAPCKPSYVTSPEGTKPFARMPGY